MNNFIVFKKWIMANVQNLTFTNEDFSAIRSVYEYLDVNKTIELDTEHFSKFHSLEKQRLLGIAYTPKNIRNELLRIVFEKFESLNIEDISFCDPCCGSGTFILDAIYFFQKLGVEPIKSLNHNIYFSDIDKSSVLLSLINLFLWLVRNDINVFDIYPNVSIEDFLKSSKRHDIFITNPPYIKLQNIEENKRNDLKNQFKEVFSGALGIAPLFLYHMQKLLKKDGYIGVITQNNFFTSNAAKKLRTFIGEHILRIDTFGSQQIFDDVSAYTCLIFTSYHKNENFIYSRDSQITVIKNNSLEHSKWRLCNQKELDFLCRVENNGIPLNKICDIFVGIATLKDKAYTTFKYHGVWYSKSPDNILIEIEEDLVKKLIKISELQVEEDININARGIIYPYQIKNNKPILIEEQEFRIKYPKTYYALSLWKKELEDRSSYKKEKHLWYQWGRNQSMIPISNKILTKTFDKRPNFMFDSTNSLISNGYGLVPKHKGISIKFIQKILNSQFFEHYVKLTSYEIEGEYQCYQKNFIERFSIPEKLLDKQSEILDNLYDIDTVIKDYYYNSRL